MASDTCTAPVLLQEKLPLYPTSKGVHHVAITQDSLSVTAVGAKTNNKTTEINFADVTGCDCMKGAKKEDRSAYVTVYAYPHKKKWASKKTQRQRQTLTLKFNGEQSYEENTRVANVWKHLILHLSRKTIIPSSQDLSSLEVPASKKYLILVNPHSGPGKALSLFKERAVPMLAEAGVKYQMVITEYAGHANSLVQALNLEDWDGIVIVSGDGLIYEVINGLMMRPDWEKAIKTPVGALPGGSANAFCCALNYMAKEPYLDHCFLHSTFLLSKQQPVPMDLVAVDTIKERLYSFLAITWGIIADVDIESEKFRALGTARFTMGALVKLVGLKKYRGRLSFLPVNKYERLPPNMKRSQSVDMPATTEKQTVLIRSQSQTEPLEASANGEKTRSKSQPAMGGLPENGVVANGVDVPDEEQNGSAGLVKVPDENGDNMVSEATVNGDSNQGQDTTPTTNGNSNGDSKSTSNFVPTPLLNPLSEPVPEDWVTVEDEFVFILAIYQTHLGQDNIVVPTCKLDEGVIHLCIGRGALSRSQVLGLMTAMSEGTLCASHNTELFPVRAFRLEPITPEGIITVDGECVDYGPIQAQVLPSMAKVMTLQK